jgi:hypothetical protein
MNLPSIIDLLPNPGQNYFGLPEAVELGGFTGA